MTYKLHFNKEAKKEWDKLNQGVQTQFKKKLRERLIQPHVPSAKLRSMKDCYKIKLRNIGYRLVYRVDDDKIIVTVLAVGKRDRNKVYKTASKYA